MPASVHDDAGAERVKQDVHAVSEQQIVRRAFVGRRVVGLRRDLAEHDMRCVEPAEPVDPRQELIGDAVNHLLDFAMDVGVQPAEVGDARGRSHAAEEAVTLDQQRLASVHGSRRRSRDPGGAAAEHDHIVFAAHGKIACRLPDRCHAHGSLMVGP